MFSKPLKKSIQHSKINFTLQNSWNRRALQINRRAQCDHLTVPLAFCRRTISVPGSRALADWSSRHIAIIRAFRLGRSIPSIGGLIVLILIDLVPGGTVVLQSTSDGLTEGGHCVSHQPPLDEALPRVVASMISFRDSSSLGLQWHIGSVIGIRTMPALFSDSGSNVQSQSLGPLPSHS